MQGKQTGFLLKSLQRRRDNEHGFRKQQFKVLGSEQGLEKGTRHMREKGKIRDDSRK